MKLNSCWYSECGGWGTEALFFEAEDVRGVVEEVLGGDHEGRSAVGLSGDLLLAGGRELVEG